MGQMMGVSDVAPAQTAPKASRLSALSALSALPALLWSVVGLLWRAGRLDADVIRFTAHFEVAMAAHPRDLGETDPMDLLDIYGDLERRLLWAWSTPIVNDFFVMIFNGVLRKLCVKWNDDGEDLHNALLAGEGGLLSAAPALEGLALAAKIRERTDWRVLFESGLSDEAVYAACTEIPSLKAAIDGYLDTWGDRCADELKLEVPTWRHRPAFFIATLRAYLAAPAVDASAMGTQDRAMRVGAEIRAFSGLGRVKAAVFRFVLARTRRRVTDRENLRFLRTRIFGRVRDIFLALGNHMHAAGAVSEPRDIFWLTTDEVFGWVRGTTVTTDLMGLVGIRSAEYRRFAAEPSPGDRFRTWGPVWSKNEFRGKAVVPETGGLVGLAACPGHVEARVVRVTDPNNAGNVDGAIMVAYRTDPGWVPLFPRIAGLVVERGSLLSHSAVVAREMGIPTVVAVPGVMDALATGDMIRLDAVAGTIDIMGKSG
jgi:pyruvate,water dikinase